MKRKFLSRQVFEFYWPLIGCLVTKIVVCCDTLLLFAPFCFSTVIFDIKHLSNVIFSNFLLSKLVFMFVSQWIVSKFVTFYLNLHIISGIVIVDWPFCQNRFWAYSQIVFSSNYIFTGEYRNTVSVFS